ncbi:hypothetical protein [Spirosoma aerophilum]
MKRVVVCLLILVAGYAKAQTVPNTVGYNRSLLDLQTFDHALIQGAGQYYYQGRAGEDFPGRDSLRKELALLRESLINYYVLLGKFPLAIMAPRALVDSSQRRVPDLVTAPTLAGPTALKWTPSGWVWPHLTKNDTCLTYTFSADSKLIALATANRLTVERVSDGTVVGTPLEKIANPTYSFSKANDLYVVDQFNLSAVLRLDPTGNKPGKLPLPDSLGKRGYRIDQILPDDSLLVIRRVVGSRTFVCVLNFMHPQKQLLSGWLNYVVNTCRLEPVKAGLWLLACRQVDKQAYHLLLASFSQVQSNSFVEVIPQKLVSEYRLDNIGNLIALQADSLLVIANLWDTSSSTTTIATEARYFDWQDNRVVYWKRIREPDRWALFLYRMGTETKQVTANSTPAGFWYDTDLRRDVPRIVLRANEVYFEDRSNNTANQVEISRLPEK